MDKIHITDNDLITQEIVFSLHNNDTGKAVIPDYVQGQIDFEEITNCYDIAVKDMTFTNSQRRVNTDNNTLTITVRIWPDKNDIVHLKGSCVITIPIGNYDIEEIATALNDQVYNATVDGVVWQTSASYQGFSDCVYAQVDACGCKLIFSGTDAFTVNTHGHIVFTLSNVINSAGKYTITIEPSQLSYMLGFTQKTTATGWTDEITNVASTSPLSVHTWTANRLHLLESFPNKYYIASDSIVSRLIKPSSIIPSFDNKNILHSLLNPSDANVSTYYENHDVTNTRYKFIPGTKLNRIKVQLLNEDFTQIHNSTDEQLNITFLIRTLNC